MTLADDRPSLPPDQCHLLLDRGPVLVRRTDREAKCDYVNESWLRFTGRSFEEQIGKGWADSLHPEDLSPYLERRGRFGRAPAPMEYRLRRHDGVYRRVRDVTLPYFEPGGEVGGYISMCLEAPDSEGSEDPTTFLRMMAHELRTPLSSMRIFVEVMRRSAARGVPNTSETFAKMDAQISRMERVVDDLSRSIRLSDQELSLENLELGDLVRRVVERRLHVDDPIRVNRRHAIAYSGVDEGRWVWADRLRIQQVFEILLNNAIKFSPRGGTIRISFSSQDRMHRVSFEDPGIGIPAKEIPLLTRRFFRASNASRENYPGLGLGLSFASEIVERHGGALTFRSQLGKGTEAIVDLPLGSPGPFGLLSEGLEAR